MLPLPPSSWQPSFMPLHLQRQPRLCRAVKPSPESFLNALSPTRSLSRLTTVHPSICACVSLRLDPRSFHQSRSCLSSQDISDTLSAAGAKGTFFFNGANCNARPFYAPHDRLSHCTMAQSVAFTLQRTSRTSGMHTPKDIRWVTNTPSSLPRLVRSPIIDRLAYLVTPTLERPLLGACYRGNVRLSLRPSFFF